MSWLPKSTSGGAHFSVAPSLLVWKLYDVKVAWAWPKACLAWALMHAMALRSSMCAPGAARLLPCTAPRCALPLRGLGGFVHAVSSLSGLFVAPKVALELVLQATLIAAMRARGGGCKGGARVLGAGNHLM